MSLDKTNPAVIELAKLLAPTLPAGVDVFELLEAAKLLSDNKELAGELLPK